jgi:hypothetical protein
MKHTHTNVKLFKLLEKVQIKAQNQAHVKEMTLLKNGEKSWGLVAHICNPSYLGG